MTIALVTGANRGLGRALVEALIERGSEKIYAGVRDPDAWDAMRTRYGPIVIPLPLDLSDRSTIVAAATLATDVDLLINNAATARFSLPLRNDRADIELEIMTNYLGTYDMIDVFTPILEHRHATIVTILSMLALVNEPTKAGYSASKAALHSMTESMRDVLASRNVTICAAYPAGIDTDMLAAFAAPKTHPSIVAHGILDGVQSNKPRIFPDPNSTRMAAALGLRG